MAPPLPSPARIVRFGVFELDLRSGELTSNGRRQTLPEQPFALLKALLERPGELVTRDELRHQLWPGDTFVDFEHGLNAAVKRLRDALRDSADSPRFIETVPRRGYRFVAPVERQGQGARPEAGTPEPALSMPVPVAVSRLPGPEDKDVSPGLRGWLTARAYVATIGGRRLLFVVALLLIGAGAVGWRLRQSLITPAELSPHVLPLTTLDGAEYFPTLSPDGNQVAFSWNGEKHDNWDIYVKLIGSLEVRRVTTDDGDDYAGGWSPDGRRIAFVRCRRGILALGTNDVAQDTDEQTCRVHLTSPLGGSDRKLSDFPVNQWTTWSPDGRFLVVSHAATAGPQDVAGIYLIPAEGGEPRRIVSTKPSVLERSPVFSQDGEHLAYAECVGPNWMDCSVNVLDLDLNLAPMGRSRRLTSRSATIHAVAWSRDGTGVVYDVEADGGTYLWRVDAAGSAEPERIELAGLGAEEPATVFSRNRLAFVRSLYDLDIYRFKPGHAPERVLGSSFWDVQPALSPDGHWIAFCTARSADAIEIWLAAADGSGERQLTHGPGSVQCAPHWSPDAQHIAFNSKDSDGKWHVWSIDAEGTTSLQLTRGAGNQNAPTWSRDGRWVYFRSDRDGLDIWRVRAEGGPEERVTRGGGAGFGCESADGKSFLYKPSDSDSPLLTVPVSGGPPHELVRCVRKWGAFAAMPSGIYYLECGTDSAPSVHVVDPTTGRDRVVGKLDQFSGPSYGLAVSPDGSVLYARFVSSRADLMLIDNFR